MRVTSRYWVGVALDGVLTLFAVVLGQPAPLVGAAGIGAWLLAHQFRFSRQTTRTVGRLSVTQWSSRDHITKDEPFALTVDASLDHPSPLDVEVEMDPSISIVDVSEGERRCVIERGEESASTTATVVGAVAGQVSFGRPRATLRDPFGLFIETVPVGESIDVEVNARPPRDLHVGAGGERMVIGYGEHDTARSGDGLEPAEVREYTPGDEFRRIDWKATARFDHPHVRMHERQTPRRTALVVDHRASMGVGSPGERMLDYARDVALLFLNNASVHGDPVSCYAIGDEGLTIERRFGAGVEHYGDIRQRLMTLTPTSNPDASPRPDLSFDGSPARAHNLNSRLGDEATPFAQTLRPYLSSRNAYLRRLEGRPLFSAVRIHATGLHRSTWTVFVTNDRNRAELHSSVKLASRGEGHVAVFITPSVLFEPDTAADRESQYRRYRDFEEFRQKLGKLSDVTAFEVGPGDRIEAILATNRSARRQSAAGARRRRFRREQ
jgi:uncharacterized protein (DUF58 family)